MVSAGSRRWPSLLAVCGLLIAVVALPAGAQVAPTVSITTLSPRCADSGTVNISVRGTTNGSRVLVELFSPTGELLDSDMPFADGGWSSVNLSFSASARPGGSYEVRATVGTARASGFIEVPCQPQSLEYDPPCFPPGYSGRVTMTARHFPQFATANNMVYDLNGAETQRQQVNADGAGVFRASFSVKPSDRPYPGQASDANGGLRANATWSPCPPVTSTTTTSTTRPTTTTSTPDDTVPDEEPATTTSLRITGTTTTIRPSDPPGPSVTVPPTIDLPPVTVGATLTVTPELGPAGFVPGVTGTGFPPGPVELRWEPGIGRTIAIAGADGTFVTRVLVMPNDRLGPRALVATGGTTVAIDAFLVVPSSVQPSGQNVQQINRIRRFNQR